MHFKYYKMLETNYCEITTSGNFGNETCILMKYSWIERKWIFVTATEIWMDGHDYEYEEIFEEVYPGLLETIRSQLVYIRKD